MKRILLLLLLINVTCSRTDKKNGEKFFFKYKDISGVETVFEKVPERVISISPELTEILFDLGCDRKIVGVTRQCNYPEKALKKEKIGDFSQINFEKTISLKPDVVFSSWNEQIPSVNKLRKMNIPVVVFYPSKVDDLKNEIEIIGRLLKKEKKAKRLIWKIERKIRPIRHRVDFLPYMEKVSVFVEICDSPLITAGNSSFTGDIIKKAGGLNIAYDLKKEYGKISPETVIMRNPDFIIIAHKNGTNRLSRSGWENIKAVSKNQIITNLNLNTFLRATPRTADTIAKLFFEFYKD